MVILVLDFILLTLCGYVIFSRFYKAANKLLTLGASMIVGPLSLLFILSILSYIFKGRFFIILIFTAYVFSCLLILRHKIRSIHFSGCRKLFLQNKLISIFLLIYVSLIFLYASGFDIGADGDLYWGIATSFTRGNYPTVLPWQPNFLTVYHEGTFVVEGALRALAPVGIVVIHNFFSAFILSAIFFLVTGLMREKTRSTLCLLPAILGIFLFGGPVFPIDNVGQFLSSIGLKNLIQYPGYENFRGGNGSGVSDFLNLMYQNFYTFGLATFLFFTYIFYLQSKKNYNFRNFLFLLILSVLTASIDETFFPVEIIMVSFLLIVQLRLILKSKLLEVLSLLIITGLSFWLIQNPIRDSLLTPSPELPRFKLLLETDSPLLQKYAYRKGETVRWNGKDIKHTAPSLAQNTLRYLGERQLTVNRITFYIVDFKLMAVIVLTIGLLIGSRLSVIFAVSACFSSLFAIFLVNTFWIPNNLRFANQASQLLMFGMGVLLVDLVTHKWKKVFFPIVILCLIVLTPQFLVSHSKFINFAFMRSHPYFNFTNSQIDQRLAEVEAIVPLTSKIIFLDAYPVNAISTYLNASASSRYGLFVPFFSAAPKILNPAMGMEWYDAVSTLSPYAFKTLNIDYLMVDATAFTRLTDLQIKKINNESYFKKIENLNGASLYKVQPIFKQLPDDGMNIKNMIFQIEPGSKVYLDRFEVGELRGILLVQLAQRVHLTGSPYAHTGEIMYIETVLPFEDACKGDFCTLLESKNIRNLDYALMSPEQDPNLLFDSKFEKVASGVNVDLWRAMTL